MREKPASIYIALISIHGLIRGNHLELGRDADTGGQTLYVLELAKALARQPHVARVDLITRRVVDSAVSADYSQALEPVVQGRIPRDKLHLVRLDAGPAAYIPKEQLWDHLDIFADNALEYFKQQQRTPDIVHSHYADAGYVGARLANVLGAPLIHTGHSLGRVKRQRLLAGGLSAEQVQQRYCMDRRIEAEELTLANAERVITSTHQEIEEQYELYDHYQPEQMRVLPPGTDLNLFQPPSDCGSRGRRFYDKHIACLLKAPDKPIILALSRPDHRKNIAALVEAFGKSARLQQLANLVIVAGNRDDIDDLDEGAREVFTELLIGVDRHDLYGKVAMPKHHKREHVPLFYQLAAASGGVFVNPALTEPFGLTLIEAAASGLPIVATEDGGPRDIIANCKNGLLIDPLEPETITDALLKLLTDEVYHQSCVDAGLKGVREHYSWDAHAAQYLKLVRPIVERTELLVRKPLKRRQGMHRSKAIFSDLDQNLLGDNVSLNQFVEVLRAHRKDTLFGVATGRRLDSALKMMKKHGIPVPDILITSGGTEICYAPKLIADTAWTKHIDYHWMPGKVRQLLDELPGLKRQAKHEQSRYKISYYIDPDIAPSLEELNSLLHQEELSAHIHIAFGQYLDALPIRASKGLALRYVAHRWQIPLEQLFVAGGSGADEDMMRGNTLAAVVANRHHEELSQLSDLQGIYFAKNAYAAGILEALEHYGFFHEEQSSSLSTSSLMTKVS